MKTAKKTKKSNSIHKIQLINAPSLGVSKSSESIASYPQLGMLYLTLPNLLLKFLKK